MLHRKYFLIEPLSGTLADLGQSLTEEQLVLCNSPQLMSHEFADKAGWTTADVCLVVKLAYLAQTLDIFQNGRKRAQIFGTADISEAVFDRWWSITETEYLGQAIECAQELRSFSSNLNPGNSPVVTSWLQLVMSE